MNVVIVKCNNAPKPTLSEILNGLDMVGAAKDMRRFNFVYKVRHLWKYFTNLA